MRLYRCSLCSFMLLILSWFVTKGNAEKRSYMTYDMSVICKQMPQFKIRMHHSNAGSTGILKAKDYLSEEEEKECVVKIKPPSGYGVIYHFEGLHLRRDANNDCRDYLKIYSGSSRANTTAPLCRDCCRFSKSELNCPGHCGYESDGLVCEEFCDRTNDTAFHGTEPTTGPLSVHYHTRCGTCTSRREQVGFRMVFTAYKLHAGSDVPCSFPSDFRCDNGRCIWSGLTCDGHNNCGDMSDEGKAGNSHCAQFPDPVKAAIIASAVIVTVLLMVVLAYLPKLTYLHSFMSDKRKSALAMRRHHKKSSTVELIKHKPSTTKSVSFHIPTMPQIREVSISETEV